ncbi:hypothetical protein HDU87_002308 [Geranomyces variabilis]|uniref:Uncharacterized protein n=1 Tax=Geranomyces variabilis TaxID=109894 RepID=A0AAD5TM19_9FUNG|nr:hypothetical protein HDU87_002308 [Geranomyces variabilis]
MNTPKGFFSPWGGSEPPSAGGREPFGNLRHKQRLNFNFCVAQSQAFDPVTYTPRSDLILKCQFMDSVADASQTTVRQLKKQVLATWKAVEESSFDRIVDPSHIRKVTFRNSDNSNVPDHLPVADAFDDRECVHVLGVMGTESEYRNLVISENLASTVPLADGESHAAPVTKRRREDDDEDHEKSAEKQQAGSENSEQGSTQALKKRRRGKRKTRTSLGDDASTTDAEHSERNFTPLVDSPPRKHNGSRSQVSISRAGSDSEKKIPTSISPPGEPEAVPGEVASVEESADDLPSELAKTAPAVEDPEDAVIPEHEEEAVVQAESEDEEAAAKQDESETEDEEAEAQNVEDVEIGLLPSPAEPEMEEDEEADEDADSSHLAKENSPEQQHDAESEAEVAENAMEHELLPLQSSSKADVDHMDEELDKSGLTQLPREPADDDALSESEDGEEIPDTQKTAVLTPSRNVGRNAALMSPPTSQDEAKESSPVDNDSSSEDDEYPAPSQLLLSQPTQQSPGGLLSRPTLDYFSQASQINLQASQSKPQSASELKRQLVPAKKLFRPPMPSGPRRVQSLSEIAESTCFPSLAEISQSKLAAKRSREDYDDEEEEEDDDDDENDSASDSSSSSDSSDAETAKPAQPAIRLAGQKKKRKKKSPFLDLALDVARQPKPKPLRQTNAAPKPVSRPRVPAPRKPAPINAKHLGNVASVSRSATPITSEALRSAVVQPTKTREELARELDGLDSD